MSVLKSILKNCFSLFFLPLEKHQVGDDTAAVKGPRGSGMEVCEVDIASSDFGSSL